MKTYKEIVQEEMWRITDETFNKAPLSQKGVLAFYISKKDERIEWKFFPDIDYPYMDHRLLGEKVIKYRYDYVFMEALGLPYHFLWEYDPNLPKNFQPEPNSRNQWVNFLPYFLLEHTPED